MSDSHLKQPPSPDETTASHRAKLEKLALAHAPGFEKSRALHDEIANFLTHVGESPILARWLMDCEQADARVRAPHGGPPEVSIVIPCHNYGAYLGECLDSVLQQTFTAWEAIVIDDGSTDSSLEVAKSYERAHPEHSIRVFTQERHGIVQPRNRGVTLAKGEFILALDADDVLSQYFLENTVRALRDDPALGYVSTKTLFFGSINSIWPSGQFVPWHTVVTNQQTNTTLYRKKMWRDIGGYDPRMNQGYVDWEFWIRATAKGWTGRQLDLPLFYYRRKEQSVVTRAKARDVQIKKQIVELHPELYDMSQWPLVKDEIATPNWIPPRLLRPEIRAKLGDVDQGESQIMEHVLGLLRGILPEWADLFTAQRASNTLSPALAEMRDRVSRLASELSAKGAGKEALTLRMELLAATPLLLQALLDVVDALRAVGRLEQAQLLCMAYVLIVPEHAGLRCAAAGGQVALALAEHDPARRLGLLESAMMIAPEHAETATHYAGALRKMGHKAPHGEQALSAAKADRFHVWYVSDAFGTGSGGLNGVSMAKFMTLASLVAGEEAPQVSVITPLTTDITRVVAEFAHYAQQAWDGQPYSWPRWHGTYGAGKSLGWTRPPSGRPDLIVLEGVRLGPHRYLQQLGLESTCPRIYMHHASPDQYTSKYNPGEERRQAFKIFSQYSGHVCVSRNVMQQWQTIPGIGEVPWVCIPNCAREEEVDAVRVLDRNVLRRELNLPPEAFICLCLASVQQRKGQDLLLDQVRGIAKRHPQAFFAFVGPVLPGEWHGEEIVARAHRDFSESQVKFYGAREDALRYLRAADCLVLPSREEAMPLTILEAMCMGVPCVASDVNGIPELIKHGHNGLLFSHQSPEGLGEGILALMDDPELGESYARAGRERYAARFSREKHARRWHEALRFFCQEARPNLGASSRPASGLASPPGATKSL